MNLIRTSLFLIIIFTGLTIQAQIQYTTDNKKAIKYFDKAMNYYQAHDNESCISSLKSAIKEDGEFAEAHLLLAQVYDELKQYPEALVHYKAVVDIDPDFFLGIYYNMADIQINSGIYDSAKMNYEKYLEYENVNEKLLPKINFNLKNCEFAIEALKNPVPFTPVNLGDSINTENSEYSPSLTVDEQTMVITVLRPRDDLTITGSKFEEDFYISRRWPDSNWSMVKKAGSPLNSHGNEGAQSIAPDGKIMFFTACDRPGGMGSCDIYISYREGNSWTMPKNMGIKVNSSSWDSQPSISPDGRSLYFASARPGGKGNMDIWVTTKNEAGIWDTPLNLSDSINTERAEMSPFIHPDGKTLFFTSNGHPGMGSFDIFYSKRYDDGSWSKPKNLGYPINTYNEEGYMIVNAAGNRAYFSSDKFNGKGKLDIYYFDLYDEARPVAVTYMKGTVYNSKTHSRLQARFELIDLETQNVVAESYSDAVSGEFLVCLPTDKNYALNVSKDSYLFYSENFEIKGEYSQIKPYLKDIMLQPIDTGETVVLKNIFFDFDKFDLLPESLAELNKLTGLLQKNPAMKIEIGGHTDNKGSAEYNQKLSEQRARSVYEFLIAKGIDKNRLSYKGYGLTKPIDTNDTEEGRANNRRTEFKVMGY